MDGRIVDHVALQNIKQGRQAKFYSDTNMHSSTTRNITFCIRAAVLLHFNQKIPERLLESKFRQSNAAEIEH